MLKKLIFIFIFLVPNYSFAGAEVDFHGILWKENGEYILKDNINYYYDVKNCNESQKVRVIFGNKSMTFSGPKALNSIFESSKIRFVGGISKRDSEKFLNLFCISGGIGLWTIPKIIIISKSHVVSTEKYITDIALRYSIYSEQDIQLLEKWNKLKKNQLLKKGQRVFIPKF